VERHGGTIAVTSRVGQGTTVTVDLPAAAATPPALLQTARPRAHEMVPHKQVASDC
jgi:chemotaxis protein histidine kinase CheA